MCDSTSYDCFIGHSREHLNENFHKTMKETIYSCEGKEKKWSRNGNNDRAWVSEAESPELRASKGIKKSFQIDLNYVF